MREHIFAGHPADGPCPGVWRLIGEDIACVRARDPAARNRFEVITIYPGVHALALYRMAHVLWRRGWRYLARWLSFFARALTQVDIHPGARIGRRCFIDHGCGVVIGETAEIGDDVTLYHGVTLGSTMWTQGKRHPTLGDRVVVGAGAKILGAIRVGDDARVAANSVVIADVPVHTTVVGIPGRNVVPRSARRITAQGIDLDHHLVPDPVGHALGCLLDRVSALEARVVATLDDTHERPGHPRATNCTDACSEDVLERCATPQTLPGPSSGYRHPHSGAPA